MPQDEASSIGRLSSPQAHKSDNYWKAPEIHDFRDPDALWRFLFKDMPGRSEPNIAAIRHDEHLDVAQT